MHQCLQQDGDAFGCLKADSAGNWGISGKTVNTSQKLLPFLNLLLVLISHEMTMEQFFVFFVLLFFYLMNLSGQPYTTHTSEKSTDLTWSVTTNRQ